MSILLFCNLSAAGYYIIFKVLFKNFETLFYIVFFLSLFKPKPNFSKCIFILPLTNFDNFDLSVLWLLQVCKL